MTKYLRPILKKPFYLPPLVKNPKIDYGDNNEDEDEDEEEEDEEDDEEEEEEATQEEKYMKEAVEVCQDQGADQDKDAETLYQDIEEFIELVRSLKLIGKDLQAFLAIMLLGAQSHVLPPSRKWRVDHLSFTPITLGSKTEGVILPSLLYVIATQHCGELRTWITFIQQMLDTKAKFNQKKKKNINRGRWNQYFQTHESCSKSHAKDIQAIHHLLTHFSADQLEDVLHTSYFLHFIPEPLPKKFKIITHSDLMWYIVSHFCSQLPEIRVFLQKLVDSQSKPNRKKPKHKAKQNARKKRIRFGSQNIYRYYNPKQRQL